ncbi:MAG: ATP-binding protein [Acidobacteriota bacterium]
MEARGLTAAADAALASRSRAGVGSYLLVLLLTTVLAPEARQNLALVVICGGLLAVIGTTRLHAALSFPTKYAADPRRWKLGFRLGAYASVLVWTVFSYAVVTSDRQGWPTWMVLVITAGLASGATSSLCPDPSLLKRYLVLLLAPMAVCGVIHGGLEGAAIFLIVSMDLGYLLMQAREHSRAFLELITGQEVLRSSQERLNLLAHVIRGVSEGVVVTDLEGRALYVNDAFLKTHGYSREELIGTPISLVGAPGNPPGVIEGILPATLRGGWQGELSSRRKDGSEFPILLSTSAIRDEEGRLVALAGVVSDITERKRAEAELRQAKEAAEAATSAKSEFLANMSHEIRTPMNGIIGMTNLALDTELDDEQREYLSRVKDSANSLLKVINDILDFSKIEARKMDLDPVEFNVHQDMEDAVKALAQEAERKGLKLACHVQPEVPRVLVGDPVRLRQVVTNLVGNALKFTGEGEVEVRVKLARQTEGGVDLDFSVRDTGAGIPAEKQARIFEAFTQADGSTTREFGGAGLGLTISAGLVARMGGRIWVESEPGRGSTFQFTARFGLPEPVRAELDAAVKAATEAEVSRLSEMVLDRKAALARVEGDRELLREMARLFLEDCPNRLAELRAAVECQDGRALERSAHALKGSVSNFCARPAAEAACSLEALGRAGDLPQAEAAVRVVEQEIARLEHALADL